MKKILFAVLAIVLVVCFVGCSNANGNEQSAVDESNSSVSTNEVSVSSISVEELPSTQFYVGDMFESTGMKLVATMSDGFTEVVPSDYEISPMLFEKAGTTTVTVTYEGATCTFELEILENGVAGITICAPARTEYTVGESFDPEGLKLIATYMNGTSEEVSEGFTWEAPEFSAPGTYDVIVCYEEKTETFVVTVSE